MPTKTRVRPCGRTQATQRFERVRQFLEVAELVADEKAEDSSAVYASAAALLAILAGIAASDAACCAAIQERSRSDSHRDAERLLAQIVPHGGREAKQLRELLNLKDKAQYGFLKRTTPELLKVMRRADQLVSFAGLVLRR